MTGGRRKYKMKKKGGKVELKQKAIESVQDWLPFEEILERGILRLKDKSYIKILKVLPINYHLKSNLEKEAILNSYKIFLQTCDFNFQILIQSNKEDLSYHISQIQEQIKKEDNEKISQIANQYIYFIQNKNLENKSSSKKFFILIKKFPENKEESNELFYIQQLNEQYFKIKECLYRCGNLVYEITSQKEVQKILQSFFNYHNFMVGGDKF